MYALPDSMRVRVVCEEESVQQAINGSEMMLKSLPLSVGGKEAAGFRGIFGVRASQGGSRQAARLEEAIVNGELNSSKTARHLGLDMRAQRMSVYMRVETDLQDGASQCPRSAVSRS